MGSRWLLLLCLVTMVIASHACRSSLGTPPSGAVPPRPFRKRRSEFGTIVNTTSPSEIGIRPLAEPHGALGRLMTNQKKPSKTDGQI